MNDFLDSLANVIAAMPQTPAHGQLLQAIAALREQTDLQSQIDQLSLRIDTIENEGASAELSEIKEQLERLEMTVSNF